MKAADYKMLIIRHRVTFAETAAILAVTVVGGVLAWWSNLFAERSVALETRILEFSEILALAALAFALFSVSQFRAQLREGKARRAAEAEARALALEDPLTGLPNRRQFDAALKAALDAPPGSHAVHAVMMLDLNGFKRINDVFGHPVGDEALIR
ncbi:MAG: diguanylate cyclase, partial [Afipia sp.]|nr:diguanylate cyclase [Afipia sp.]